MFGSVVETVWGLEGTGIVVQYVNTLLEAPAFHMRVTGSSPGYSVLMIQLPADAFES